MHKQGFEPDSIITTASFRERAVRLLARAFTSLPLPLAQTYLGLPVDQLLSGPYAVLSLWHLILINILIVAAEKQGWKYDASSQVLSPVPISTTPAIPAHENGMDQNVADIFRLHC